MFTIRDFINRAKNIVSAADIENACRERSVISSEMAAELLNWNDIYQNKAAWLNKDSDTKSLNLGVSIAAEFARLVMLELKSEVNEKDARGKFINGVYQKYLEKLRPAVERACALGGVCFKPYVADGEIKVDVIDPLDFIPLESDDEGRITAAVFLSRKDKEAKRYTKLEVHKFSNNSEQVRNICYCSSVPESSLGNRCVLGEVSEWAELPEQFVIKNIAEPLFCYFKMPFSNEVDRLSPLGVSVYSRAVELLRDADEQYTRFLWEFEGGELAVFADQTMLKNNAMPAHHKRIFKKLTFGLNTSGDTDFYHEYSPTLRDESLKNGLNTILRRIEFSCSLAYGTLSEVSDTEKTAEEIRNSKQRSYAAVRDIQNSLEHSLRELAYIIGVWGGIYGMCEGTGNIEMSFEWDDSIVSDRAQEFTEKTQLVRDGIMQPWEFRAWYFGEDKETAKRMVAADAELDTE